MFAISSLFIRAKLFKSSKAALELAIKKPEYTEFCSNLLQVKMGYAYAELVDMTRSDKDMEVSKEKIVKYTMRIHGLEIFQKINREKSCNKTSYQDNFKHVTRFPEDLNTSSAA